MNLAYMKRIATYLGREGGFYVSRPGGGAPAAHHTTHETGGSDIVTPTTHASRHQNGGADQISVAGLTGLLGTAQTPATHASSHQNSGSDEIAVAAAAANAIPKAGSGGRLAVGWEPAIMGAMKQIYSNTVTGAAVTSWSITSGLAGNTDLIYLIRFRLVEAQLNTVLGLTLNNDTGGNYADTGISNTNTTVTGSRNTGATRFPLCFVNAAGHTAEGFVWLYAVSGQVRHMFLQAQEQVTATVPTTVVYRSGMWTNTASEITRMDVTASVASGIGINSTLEIWAFRPTYAAAS